MTDLRAHYKERLCLKRYVRIAAKASVTFDTDFLFYSLSEPTSLGFRIIRKDTVICIGKEEVEVKLQMQVEAQTTSTDHKYRYKYKYKYK